MNKVVIITGASSGIGLATAEFLSAKGYTVYGLSRKTFLTNKYTHLLCDVTKEEEIKNIFRKVYEKEKRIDAVINNAGIGVSGAVEYSTNEELERIFSLNVNSVIKISQIAIPYLRESQGRIINISSVASEMTIPFQTYYSMTKACVNVLTEGLRMELKPFHIQVTAVLPGDTKTAFTSNRSKPSVNRDELYKERIVNSLKRMEKDEENGVHPIKVAKVIYKVLKKKKAPVKVTVGFKYKLLVFMKRFVSQRFLNYVLYKMYGK